LPALPLLWMKALCVLPVRRNTLRHGKTKKTGKNVKTCSDISRASRHNKTLPPLNKEIQENARVTVAASKAFASTPATTTVDVWAIVLLPMAAVSHAATE